MDKTLSNGREYTSAEWLRAMIEIEVEGYAPNEMLSVVPSTATLSTLPLVPPGASQTVATVDDLQADAGCFPAGAGAEVLA